MPRKPRRREVITFLDVGSGPQAEHGFRLAKHREDRPKRARGRFVSVDIKQRQVLTGRYGGLIGQPHHRFVQKNIFEFLERRKPNSVRIINDNGCLDENLSTVAFKAMHSNKSFVPVLREISRTYFGKVARVMIPGGRIFVTVLGNLKNIIKEEMEEAGLEVLSEKELPAEEIQRGTSEWQKNGAVITTLKNWTKSSFCETQLILNNSVLQGK